MYKAFSIYGFYLSGVLLLYGTNIDISLNLALLKSPRNVFLASLFITGQPYTESFHLQLLNGNKNVPGL
jgi:hypothetical protein